MSRAKATILCIADHWNGLIGRKMLLEQNGYRVLEAASERDGLQLFLSQPVDAVVLDFQKAGIRADVFAAQIRRINSQVPIVVLSPRGQPPKGQRKSVDTLLSKAQPPKILAAALHQLLDSSPKPFFYRWLDNWKARNQGAQQ